MTCRHCKGLLGLLEEAVAAGLTFSAEESRLIAAKAEREIEELTATLGSRGYTCRDGVWGWHDRLLRMPCSDKIQ